MQRIPFARCTQTLLAAFGMTGATGLATCDSGPQSGWQWKDVLSQRLSARVEAYFHPVTRTARGLSLIHISEPTRPY